jgi:hypothetical protein
MTAESKAKETRVLVIGTRHEFQRHQDTMPKRESVRAEFKNFLRKIIVERQIDLVAEEAGDDHTVWEHLKCGETTGELESLWFGEGSATVDSPVPTIAKIISDEYEVRHEDVDVEVRADERDPNSIQRRDVAITEKILKVLGNAESALVIVGDAHRASVAARLQTQGLLVEAFSFP